LNLSISCQREKKKKKRTAWNNRNPRKRRRTRKRKTTTNRSCLCSAYELNLLARLNEWVLVLDFVRADPLLDLLPQALQLLHLALQVILVFLFLVGRRRREDFVVGDFELTEPFRDFLYGSVYLP
jgi:hypothetical protein